MFHRDGNLQPAQENSNSLITRSISVGYPRSATVGTSSALTSPRCCRLSLVLRLTQEHPVRARNEPWNCSFHRLERARKSSRLVPALVPACTSFSHLRLGPFSVPKSSQDADLPFVPRLVPSGSRWNSIPLFLTPVICSWLFFAVPGSLPYQFQAGGL